LHTLRRLTVLALATSFVTLATAIAARADGTGDAWTDGQHIGAGASSGGSGDAATGGGGASKCEWELLDAAGQTSAEDMSQHGWGDPHGPGPGAWYRRICSDPSGLSTGTVAWVANAVDVAALAQQAADAVAIPRPSVHFNPSEQQGAVVNVPTWLWVDPASWQPVTAQASAGGVVVTATAAPQRVEWDMGNGDRIVCHGPGTPYDSGRPTDQQSTSCSYTYRSSSAGQPNATYKVTATVVWAITWTAAGAPGGGSLGTAPQSQSVRLPVKEIQALNH